MERHEQPKGYKLSFAIALIGLVLLTIVSLYLYTYLQRVGMKPRSSFGVALCTLPFLVGLVLFFRGRKHPHDFITNGKALPFVGFLTIFTALYYWDAFGNLKGQDRQAAINLKVSEICYFDRDLDAETRRLCRQILTEHGGYLCSVGEEPMNPCEQDLRKAAGLPLDPTQP